MPSMHWAGSRPRRYSTYLRSGNSLRPDSRPFHHQTHDRPRSTNAGRPPCRSPRTSRSSRPSAPWRTPSCDVRSSTSAWSATWRWTTTAVVDVQIALTVAGCPLRNEITSRVTAAVAPLPGVQQGHARLHGHDRPGARGRAHDGARQPRRHRRPGSGARPCRGPQGALRRARLEDTSTADLVGQGWRRQVQRHRQPRRRSWPSRATRSASSMPTSTASRSRACSAPTVDPVVIDGMLVPPESHGVRCISIGYFVPEGPGGHLAGPDAAQGARAVPHRRVLGRARLPARSTCPPAPATSPSASASTCRGRRSTSSPRRSPPPRRSPRCRRPWPPRSTCR